MAPTIIKYNKIRVMIYVDDHGSPHVHIKAPGADAKIYLSDFEVVSSKGFSQKALRRIVKQLKEDKEILLEAWSEYHE